MRGDPVLVEVHARGQAGPMGGPIPAPCYQPSMGWTARDAEVVAALLVHNRVAREVEAQPRPKLLDCRELLSRGRTEMNLPAIYDDAFELELSCRDIVSGASAYYWQLRISDVVDGYSREARSIVVDALASRIPDFLLHSIQFSATKSSLQYCFHDSGSTIWVIPYPLSQIWSARGSQPDLQLDMSRWARLAAHDLNVLISGHGSCSGVRLRGRPRPRGVATVCTSSSVPPATLSNRGAASFA